MRPRPFRPCEARICCQLHVDALPVDHHGNRTARRPIGDDTRGGSRHHSANCIRRPLCAMSGRSVTARSTNGPSPSDQLRQCSVLRSISCRATLRSRTGAASYILVEHRRISWLWCPGRESYATSDTTNRCLSLAWWPERLAWAEVGCTAIAGLATRPRPKVAGRVHGGEEVRRWGWTKNFEGLCPRSRGDRVGKLHARIDSTGVT